GPRAPRVRSPSRLRRRGADERGSEGCNRSDAWLQEASRTASTTPSTRLVNKCTSALGWSVHRAGAAVVADSDGPTRRIPEATVARLPLYHRVLLDLTARGDTTISSDQLASGSGVNAAKVRKDLSYLGTYGTRGVGYSADALLHEIGREL